MMSDVLLSLASRAVHSKTGMLPFSTLEKYANNKRVLDYSQAGSDFNEIKNPSANADGFLWGGENTPPPLTGVAGWGFS